MAVVCLSLLICNCQNGGATEEKKTSGDRSVTLTTDKDKVSYIIGSNMALSLMSIKDEINPEMLKKGFDDKLSNGTLLIAEEEADKILQDFSRRIQEKQVKEREARGEANLAAGAAFLEENAKKDGVVTTASGLQYMVIKKGEGSVPSLTDTVKVDYEGATIEGEVFDSSYQRGEPMDIPLANMISGWKEALQLMPVGSKYKLFIPSELAYGERGAGPHIEPNAALIFDVELLDIVKQDGDVQPGEKQE